MNLFVANIRDMLADGQEDMKNISVCLNMTNLWG